MAVCHSRTRSLLLALVAGFALLGFWASDARAATGNLKPNVDTVGTAGNAWDADPNDASFFWDVLDDTNVRPWAPGSGDNAIIASAATPASAEVGLETYALAAGEQMTLVRAWAHIEPSTGRPLTWELRTGATVLASGTVPAGAPMAWRSVEWDGGLTQAQIDDLRLRFTTTSLSGDTNVNRVRSAYVEYQTAIAPAAPTITVAQPSPGKTLSPAWTWTPDAAAVSDECQLERGSTVVFAWGTCVSPDGFAMTGEPDGTYRFRVRSIGSGGLAGPIASAWYVLDTTAPNTPSITSGPTGQSQNAMPAYTFTGEAGATFRCRMEGPAVVEDWTTCVSGKSYNLSLGALDGAYTFRVTATDAAGNESTQATRIYTLDRSAPDPPTVTPPASPSKLTNASWSWTTEAGATTECRLEFGATVVSNWGACTSPRAYTVGAQGDGTYTFKVRATDQASNLGTEAVSTYVLDRAAPSPPTITGGPSGDTKNPSPAFTFTSEAGATFECRLERGGTTVSDWATCASPRTYNLSGEVDGAYTFRVRATDVANNQGTEATRGFTLDRQGPVAPTIGSGPTGQSQNAAPSYAFTGEAGASFRCRIERPGFVVSDWAPCVSPRSYDLSLQPDAVYTFSVLAVDAALNDGAVATRTYTLDTTKPVPPTFTSTPPAQSKSATPSFGFSSELGATTQCKVERGATLVSDWAACSTPTTLALGGEADGVYTFSVRATDAANNVGDPATHTWTVDRSAPTTTIDSGPSGPTKVPNVTWTFSTEAGATTECRVETGAGAAVSDWSSCSATRTYDLSGQVDGTFTFRVRATDAATNTGTDATRTIQLDRNAPLAPTIATGPTGFSRDTSLSYAFTGEAGASFECRIERPGFVVSDWSSCVAPRTYEIAVQPDGVYTFSVRATDAALNTGAVATRTYTLDRQKPLAPTVTGGPIGDSPQQTPVFSFTGEAGANFECRVQRGGTDVQAWGACSSPKGYDLTNEVDGTYTFSVRASDAAGNVSDEGSRTYTLDRAKPAPPVIGTGPASPSKDATPEWAFTAESGATASCRVERGATVVSDWATCTSPGAPNLAGEVDGTYTFRVRATDAAGNTSDPSSSSYVLDRAAPVAPTVTAAPAPNSQDATPDWSFTAESGAQAECRLDKAGTQVEDWQDCSSPTGYDLTPAGLGDGTYTFSVRATDAADNTGAITTSTYTLDRADPAPPTITTGPATNSADAQPQFGFTGEAGATFACRVERGGVVVAATPGCVTPAAFDLRGEADATYTFIVTATDAAGNQSDEATRSYTLDRDNPDGPVITAGPAAFSPNDQPAWSFTYEPGSGPTCRLERGATVVSDWAPCVSPRSYNLGVQLDGAYTFRVRTTDAAGNESVEASAGYTLDRAKPAAPAVTSGPAADSQDDTPTFDWSAEPGATPSCRLERGATVVSDWGPCSTPQTYTVGTDGLHTFRVRVTDAAGNTSDEGVRTYTLDRNAPNAPMLTGTPTADSKDDTPTWSWTAEAGAVVECEIERSGTTIVAWTACASPHTANLGPQADGTYTFRVRARDAAGNTGASAMNAYTLDRSAPNAPVVTSGPPASSSDAQPAFSFTTETGSSPECQMEREGVVVDAWAPCTSAKSYNLTSQLDGSFTFRVRTTDAALNTSAVASRTFTLDRVAPGAPVLTSRPPSSTNSSTASWSWTVDPGAEFYACRLSRDGGIIVSDWAYCSTPKSYDLSALPDGVYQFTVYARDYANNAGTWTTDNFAVDRARPNAPNVTTGPIGPSQTDQPSYAFTAEAGATTACRIERGGAAVSDWAACSSPRVYDLRGEADGAYIFRVRATDAAGNESLDGTRSYTLDRADPAEPVITSRPADDSSDATPTWGFTAEAGADVECRVDRGATTVQGWTDCASPFEPNLGPEADGTYTFTVRATDAAGNESTHAIDSYRLDRNAPVAPTISSGPATDSQDDTPTYAFTAEAGATTTCRVERGAAVISDWASCTDPATFDLTTRLDGTYAFHVRATDAAGNTGPAATRTYTLDRTAPSAPSFASTPAADSRDDTPTWDYVAEAGATARCQLDRGGTIVEPFAACGDPRGYDLTSAPDGTYTFSVDVTDAAGNTSPVATSTYRLDRAAPVAPTITTNPAASSADDTPQYAFTAEAGAAVTCKVERGGTPISDWASCTSPREYDLRGQPDGTYVFSVRATDAAGNEGAIATHTYALDRNAPGAPTITGTPSTDSSDDTPTYAFTAEAGATASCRVERGATAVSDWATCTSPRTFALGSEPDGTYTFRVRATDAAGNTGGESAHTYTLDRTNPSAPTITDGPTVDSNDDTPTYTFTAETGAAMSCRIDRGGVAVVDWAPCSSPRTYALGSEPDGTYTFRVRATDAAANTGGEATRTYALDRSAPVAPAITAGPATDSTDDTPTWSFTAEAGAALECRVQRGATVVDDWSSCVSPRTYDLSGNVDGTYTFRVRATDAARNTGADASRSYTLDRVVPVVPAIDARPGAQGNDRTPAWSFSTGEANRTLECRLTRGATVVSAWADCASPAEFSLLLEPDATYTFAVRAYNPAGTRSPAATDDYRLDTAVPAAPVISNGPAADSTDDTPSWTLTAEAGGDLECRLDRDGSLVLDWADCASPVTYDLTSRADGAYTLRTRITDAAGNQSTESSSSYNLDRTVPAAPVLGANPAAADDDPSPSWAFTGEPGKTFECRVTRGGTTLRDWSACTSPLTVALGGEPDGTYTFAVRAVNAAGTRSPSTTDTYDLDRVDPAAPAITDAPPADSNDATPTYTFTAEAGATTECRIERGGTAVQDWANCASPRTYNLGSEVDGSYTFRTRATDAAGNTGAEATRTYALDRAAPAPPAITASPAADSTDDTPAWSFTAETGASLECRLQRGATVVSDWASCASPRSYDLSGNADGTYTFRVRATDAAQNTGADETRSYNLDRVVPAAPTIDTRPGAQGNDRTPTWTFSTSEANRSLECRLTRGATVVSAWGPCSSPREYDLLLETDGTYTFATRAYNAAGTRGDATTDNYRLDTAAPAAPVVSGGPPADSTDDTPSWSLAAESGATLECRLQRGTQVIADWASCTSPAGFDLRNAADGSYTFRARATDAAGNTSSEGTSSYNLDRTVPGQPVLGANPPAADDDPLPSWAFTGEPGRTFECRVTRGSTVLQAWAACTSPLALNLTNEADGTYTVELRTVNAAGTRSGIVTDTYDLDRVDPAAPTITDGPPADSADATPTWTFTAEANADFECQVERETGGGATSVVDAWSSCASPETSDLGGQTDGTFTFRVRATDRAGNQGPAASRSYNLDRTVPGAPAITARPTSPSPVKSLEWTFTHDVGKTVECQLTRGSDVVRAWANCTSPHQVDLTNEVDGAYTLKLRQYNAAGTRGPETTEQHVLDSSAPAAPTITSNPGGAGNANAPRWAFAAEPGAVAECRLDRAGIVVRPWAACTSPRDYGLAGEPDGLYTFSVRATDAAGNTGATATHDHLLDRVAPAAPALTATPGPLGRGRRPSWSFAAEPGSAVQCRLARGEIDHEGWTSCGSPKAYDLEGQLDGAYAFAVRATDAAGNASPETVSIYELDTTPGAVTIEAGPGPLGRLRTPEWLFKADAGSSVECRLSRGQAAVAEWAPCGSPRIFDLAGLPDGVFRFALRATDPAGNLGPVTDTDYELDTTPPPAPALDREPESPAEDRTPTWRFSGEAGASFACRVERDGAGEVMDWTACASPFSADLARSPEGEYRFLVRATDRAGNPGPPSTGKYELQLARAKADEGPGVPTDKADVESKTVPTRTPRVKPEVEEDEPAERKPAPPADEPTPEPKPEASAPEVERSRPPVAPEAPAAEGEPEPKGAAAVAAKAADAAKAVASVVAQHPDKSVFPFSLLLLVGVFLGVQNRIDRSDPKLALAPVSADPDMEFPPEP